MSNDLVYKFVKPVQSFSDLVYGYSSLQNLSTFNEGIIIPNGKIDLLFCKTVHNEFKIVLMGLETQPKPMPKREISSFFAINFNPLALEYILQQSIADFVNGGKELPSDFWGFTIEDLEDFDKFTEKASQKIKSLLPEKIDERKQKLFELIFSSHGEIAIKDLAESINWNERQINRYFNKHLGISLKYYCKILRFQASLYHIKDGNLFPQLNFTDQSHFIKEIKKLSGVSPKELFKNENDRFLQFLIYHTT
ncbi:AraC-type DNA-binding protein [Chryseobacterium taeanense]|uniref:AraC-type DNA-binding protein n=1 Tax=Chryseobacterium taeanense TaxID=311334 RepID=A0A1G8LXS9_9FLAO|nr:AraC family transcriptional regulator [Chryseobacterium taeanense]SDI60297.1 AraC-type DNA-binding protein [Chryseobacterium taeanense]